jgi:hypothetical protein
VPRYAAARGRGERIENSRRQQRQKQQNQGKELAADQLGLGERIGQHHFHRAQAPFFGEQPRGEDRRDQ